MVDKLDLFVRYEKSHPLFRGKLADSVAKPKCVLVNKFDEEAARHFCDEMIRAQNTGQPVVPVYIDSYGGEAYSLLAMVDAIKNCKIPVATIVLGKAMSCGSILFSQGAEGKRFAAPNATIMIHDVSKMNRGKIEELKADVNEAERLNKLIYTLMSENTGHDADYFGKIVHEKSHADWYLSAEDAKQHNIANHIRIPSFSVGLDVKVSFE